MDNIKKCFKPITLILTVIIIAFSFCVNCFNVGFVAFADIGDIGKVLFYVDKAAQVQTTVEYITGECVQVPEYGVFSDNTVVIGWSSGYGGTGVIWDFTQPIMTTYGGVGTYAFAIYGPAPEPATRYTAEIKYTNTAGASVTKNVDFYTGDTLQVPNDLGVPEGWEFSRWTIMDSAITYTDFSFDTVFTQNYIDSIFIRNQNPNKYVRIEAEYKKIIITTYTVTFDANGGTGGGTKTVTSGQVVTPYTTPMRTGYDFKFWSLTAGGTYGAFNFNTAITSNVTLYAVWDAIPQFTVYFKDNLGNDISSMVVYRDEKVPRPFNAPKIDKYDFKDWYFDIEGNSLFNFDTPITTDTVIYAVYEPQKPWWEVDFGFNGFGGIDWNNIDFDLFNFDIVANFFNFIIGYAMGGIMSFIGFGIDYVHPIFSICLACFLVFFVIKLFNMVKI